MAGTFTHRVDMTGVNGSNITKFQPGSKQIVQTGIRQNDQIVNLTTSTGGTPVPAASLTTLPTLAAGVLGMIYYQCLDATNSAAIGVSTSTGAATEFFAKAKAGEPFSIRASTGSPIYRAVAIGGPVTLRWWANED